MKNDKQKINLFLFVGFLFGIYCFVFGQSGILERSRLGQQRAELDFEINELIQVNKTRSEVYLAYKNGMYNRAEAHKAGYVSPRDKVIFFEEAVHKQKISPKADESLSEGALGIQEFRYIYMIISAIIILGMIIRMIVLKKNIASEL